MLTMREVLAMYLRHLGPTALVPEVRRETIVREIIPQIRPLAKSGNDFIDAMRDVGLAYRRTDMLDDFRSTAPSLGWASNLPGGETALHVYGMEPYKYDVSMWWPDDEGDYYDAGEHRSYHREGFSIWSEQPMSYAEAEQACREIVERYLKENPAWREDYFAEHGMPSQWEVTKVHAFGASSETLDPFPWQG